MLAHLLGDYPLQTDSMVVAKKRLPGLTLHIGIHLLTMIILTLPVIGIVWPYLLVIASAHFLIDAFKNYLARRRPEIVISSYIFDQFLHFSSLVIVSLWMQNSTDLVIWYAFSPWWGIAIGLLLATYIWFITERITSYRDPALQSAIRRTVWPRMGFRFLIFVLVVISEPVAWIIATVLIVGVIIFYRRWHYPIQWIISDPIIAVATAIFALAVPVI